MIDPLDKSALRNRHVIVTGGSRGLGLALVKGLLADGYLVSTCSRTISSSLIELKEDPKIHNRIFYYQCDLGAINQADEFLAATMEWAGNDSLYGLINNAGIAVEGILATFPNVAMEEVVRVNLLAAMQITRASLRVFLRSGNIGRIINISSIIGLRGYTGLAAYSATKAGMDGMTRALAREVGRRQITVNSIAPGYLETDMSSSLSLQQREMIVRRTPIGRLGMPDDVLPVVRFLLCDQSGFITGQTITVDGGLTC